MKIRRRLRSRLRDVLRLGMIAGPMLALLASFAPIDATASNEALRAQTTLISVFLVAIGSIVAYRTRGAHIGHSGRREEEAATQPRLERWSIRADEDVPIGARFLLDLLPPQVSEELIGDLIEIYPKRVALYGRRAARIWFWWHSVRSILALLPWQLVRDAINKMIGG